MISAESLAGLMSRAVAAAMDHVEQGGLPFVGQVVSPDGDASAYGVNRVRETGDPTAHAEIVAMRDVLASGHAIEGMALLTTGEPCGLCYRFAAEHRIRSIAFAVGRDEVAAWGFDYRASYAAPGPLEQAAVRLPVADALEPFRAYAPLNPHQWKESP